MQLENKLFSEAVNDWDLEKIYKNLTKAKQIITVKPIQLSCLEKTVLCGLLCGYSPKDIANKLHCSSGALSVELTKGLYRYIEIATDRELNTIKNWRDVARWLEKAGYKTSQRIHDWGTAPDISSFYGRDEELARLEKWIVPYKYRLAILHGMVGIGKTTLALKLVKTIQPEFEFIIWRNLGSAPQLSELLTDILNVFSNYKKQKTSLTTTINEQLFQLMNYLRQHRCLIVLDNLEAVLEAGNLAGFYQEKYYEYSQLIRRLTEESHQSCALIVTREIPADALLLQGDSVDLLQLDSLEKDAKKLLIEKKLSDSNCWQKLVDRYHGNPLALKLVAETISELFDGSVSRFLETATKSSYFMPIFWQKLCCHQFERLSNLEKQIVFILATNHRTFTIEQLQEHLKPGIDSTKLLQILASLRRRSLLKISSVDRKTKFTLQPMLVEYALNSNSRNKREFSFCQTG